MSGEDENALSEPSTLSQAINKFALQLYNVLNEDMGADNSNMLISPFNLSTCLGLAYLATGGDTAFQIAATLNFPPALKDSAESAATEYKNLIDSIDVSSYKCSNGFFPDARFPVKDSFKGALASQLGGDCELVDYSKGDSARERINAWVKEKTASKIVQLLPQGSASHSTMMVLASALYFKGQWDSPFDKKQTQPVDFHMADGTIVKIPMMDKTHSRFGYSPLESLKSTVLEIPYKESRQSMIIILPFEKNGLSRLETDMAKVDFETDIIDELKYGRNVRAVIPKFKIECNYEVSRNLQQMGVTNAFCAANSDFSGCTDMNGLEVSAVFHSTTIEVDEVGTTASAASGAAAMLRCGPMRFMADHPFMYAIFDSDSRTVMFLGRFSKPN